MSDPTRLNDDEREELVAFLDGELPEDAAEKIEAKLNVDARTRAEADALRKTWDLLDYLPKPEPSPTFTSRTLERLGRVRVTQSIPRHRRLHVVGIGLAWAATLLLALVAGYAATAHFLKPADPADKDLVRDLRVIENKHLYEAGEDMDFLRELDKPDVFGDESNGS